MAQSLASLKAQSLKLGLGSRDDFQLSSSSTDAFGQTHARFEQTYQGVPVWGAMAITHQGVSAGDIRITTEGLRKNIRLGVTPALDAKSAAAKATQELAPKGELAVTPKSELIVYPQTRLVNRYPGKPVAEQNAADFDTQVVAYRLAYHVHTELENAKDGVKHTDFIVDANSARFSSSGTRSRRPPPRGSATRSTAVTSRWTSSRTPRASSSCATSRAPAARASGPTTSTTPPCRTASSPR